MNRRSFLTKMFATAAVAAIAPTSLVYAAPQAYTGELLLTIAARGGWDVTSYCDPKENVAGEKKSTTGQTMIRSSELVVFHMLQLVTMSGSFRNMLIVC